MKIFICSDIHGDFESAKRIISLVDKEGAEKLLILGDILYHGPRNNLPEFYNPQDVIKLLNDNRDIIMAVRGNCDTEVDQMVLNFPIMADYIQLYTDGLSILATHGHKYNITTPPPLRNGEILLHGHTHIPTFTAFGEENYYINPGSISLPKQSNEKTYIIYDSGTFTLKDLNQNIINSKSF